MSSMQLDNVFSPLTSRDEISRGEHQVRRLPVINNHRQVGIVSEADIARHLPEHAIAEFVKAICSQTAITSR